MAQFIEHVCVLYALKIYDFSETLFQANCICCMSSHLNSYKTELKPMHPRDHIDAISFTCSLSQSLAKIMLQVKIWSRDNILQVPFLQFSQDTHATMLAFDHATNPFGFFMEQKINVEFTKNAHFFSFV